MPVYPLNRLSLDILINENEVAVIDFWAEWCAPCKQFAPVYKKIADKYPAIKFTQVNIEEESDLAEMFHIRSIPHLIVFKQGIVIYSESGSIPESTLRDLIQQAIEADVADIKKQIDKEKE